MLSVRLPETLEGQLNAYCAGHGVSKTHVVQNALALWFSDTPAQKLLQPSDALTKWLGVVKGGMSTDELMRTTRGADWNQA